MRTELVASTVAKRGADPAHHFFASSLGEWRVNYDLGALIRTMKAQGYPFAVYLVPGAIDAHYGINLFAPQVEGAVWLTTYIYPGTRP